MVLGQVFLKDEGLAFSLSNFFKVNFYVYKLLYYFNLCEIVLSIWAEIIFFWHHYIKKNSF